MDVLSTHAKVVENYAQYIQSFLNIADSELRTVHTHVLNPSGSISLRSNRQRLEAAVAAEQVQVA